MSWGSKVMNLLAVGLHLESLKQCLRRTNLLVFSSFLMFTKRFLARPSRYTPGNKGCLSNRKEQIFCGHTVFCASDVGFPCPSSKDRWLGLLCDVPNCVVCPTRCSVWWLLLLGSNCWANWRDREFHFYSCQLYFEKTSHHEKSSGVCQTIRDASKCTNGARRNCSGHIRTTWGKELDFQGAWSSHYLKIIVSFQVESISRFFEAEIMNQTCTSNKTASPNARPIYRCPNCCCIELAVFSFSPWQVWWLPFSIYIRKI